MDPDENPHSELTPLELRTRLTIMQKMQDLHQRISSALADWSTFAAAEGGAKAARFVRALLYEVTLSLDDAYERRIAGQLHPLEQEHWVPALETVRKELRKASASLAVLPGAQLEQAVMRLRQSLARVSDHKSTCGVVYEL